MNLAKLNVSVVIALLAVLISLFSTLLSYKETKILASQQDLLVEQKEASVWPYLENLPYNSFQGDSAAIFSYQIRNKGVGPAIINEVSYTFNGVYHKNWEFFNQLKSAYPELLISQLQNADVSNTVLSAGEEVSIIKVELKLKPESNLNLSDVLFEIAQNYKLNYCYCSVYNKCWEVRSWQETLRSDSCSVRENIR